MVAKICKIFTASRPYLLSYTEERYLRDIFNFKRRKHSEVFLTWLPDIWKVYILRVSLIFEVCRFKE